MIVPRQLESAEHIHRIDAAAISRLAKIDLNLLVVFAALMHESSVTLADKRLFVGQPAVSAALGRLRSFFNDPLLVKAGRGLVPTHRALALKPQIERLLAELDALTGLIETFDPIASVKQVRIGLSDDNEIVFLPGILRELRRLAPGMTVVARPVSHTDVQKSLDNGDVDLAMSVFGELSNWHRRELLFEQGYGCLFDAAHWKTKRVSLAKYVSSHQAIVTFDGNLEGKIDRVLATMGERRTVVVGTTRFSSLPFLVKGTPIIASLPEFAGRVLASSHGLSYCSLPFRVPAGKPSIAWHIKNEFDPSHVWLRKLIKKCVDIELSQFKHPDGDDYSAHSREPPLSRNL
jgi:LysR family transcriptional regulator, mexEF-oprN operon transcriptional activator